ncbi:MAG: hypothetical protein M1817_005111 [Caeruleum heppii]|nr:MAG: hypothetical protein M1817_005111 [Caeruleum heppii]
MASLGHTRSILLSLFVLFELIYAVAVYNPSSPHYTENFDPAEADPLGNITCVGPLPPWPLPVQPTFDPNTFTLQQLCAKPQYGGQARGQHLGAYCLDNDSMLEGSLPGSIGFDDSPGAQRSNIQPYQFPEAYNSHVERLENVYRIKVDVADAYRGTDADHRGAGSGVQTHIDYATQVGGDGGFDFEVGLDVLSIDPANRITCSGPIPRFPLLPPYETHHFRSLTQLCAAQLSGGSTAANSGGYCHRNSNGGSDVWFSDEMTPRVEWTWANFLASAATRYHCWQHCRCSSGPRPENRTVAPMWRFLENADLVTRADGTVDIAVKKQSGQSGLSPSSTTKINVLPARAGENYRSAGTCGTDGRQFCKVPWPSSLLGPIPTAPPQAIPPDSPSAETSSSEVPYPQCGTTCISNQSCRGDGSPKGCRCVAATLDDAKAQGLDPVFPSALCLVTTFVAANAAAKVKPLGGRSAEGLPPLACACNQTYVSQACCGSPDGMIWEAPAMRLGKLADSVHA